MDGEMKKRVAIIGGGISGLVAIKACLEENMEPHCFERYPELGGVWVYDESLRPGQGSAMYDCLVTNSSKGMMGFSDFPMPKDNPPYLSHQHVLKYVQDYAMHFNLEQYIQFNTTVTSVKPVHNFDTTGQWEITTVRNGGKCESTCHEITEIYDAVFVCSGMYKKPYIPDYPGLGEFEGMKVHTNEYRKADPYTGKTVMVMGASNSAGDVASDISRYAEQVHLTMRHGCWVVRRMAEDSTPIDMIINRRVVQMAPDFITGKVAEHKASINFNHDKLGLTATAGLLNSEVMVSDAIGDRIFCGKVQCRPGVKRFTRHGVEFVDGTVVDKLDAVVFATGYELKFEFIDNDIIQETFKDLELYLHIFPPRLRHPTLAVIGCVTTLGGQPPVFELQTRVAAQVFKGLVKLPDVDSMMTDIQRRKEHLFKTFGKHRLFFPPVGYQDELADLIGAKPRLRDFILSEPKLAFNLFFGPCYPAHYRLQGPHTWEGARQVIADSWDDTITPTKTRVLVPKTDETNNYKFHLDFSKLWLLILGVLLVVLIL